MWLKKNRSLYWHNTQPLVGDPDEGFYFFIIANPFFS